MQRALVVGGTLGLGTAIVFGAAALAATLFPNGGTVSASWNGGEMMIERGVAMPALPAFGGDDVQIIENEKGDAVGIDQN